RVYTDDRSLDETMAVENQDCVSVPKGYHPVGVPDGYDLYYLNVMAGPHRKWVFHNDKDHEWILEREERMAKFDLITVGRAAVDFNANEIHRPMEETMTCTKYVGGSQANVAIGTAKLGLNVGMIS